MHHNLKYFVKYNFDIDIVISIVNLVYLINNTKQNHLLYLHKLLVRYYKQLILGFYGCFDNSLDYYCLCDNSTFNNMYLLVTVIHIVN